MKMILLLVLAIIVVSLSLIIGIVFVVLIILLRRWHIEKQFAHDEEEDNKQISVSMEGQQPTDDQHAVQVPPLLPPEKPQLIKEPDLPKKVPPTIEKPHPIKKSEVPKITLPPEKHGGRPRGKATQGSVGETTRMERSPIKPELICWEEGGSWILGIEIGDELEDVHVTQNDDILEEDLSNGRCYKLKQVKNSVTVTTSKGTSHIFNIPTRDGYLLFKMRKKWNGPGRFIKYPNSGYYITIVPDSWIRDEQVSGKASNEPEQIKLDGYTAHYFFLERGDNQEISFVTSGDKQIRIQTKKPSFRLTGKEIEDASDEMGPLFAGEPPLIESRNIKGWNDVGLVVVGEEGKGRNKWRMSFVPQSGYKSQKMPLELTSRKGGWYFVRVYDAEDNLLESMDFRFMKGLKAIKRHPYSHLPKTEGHKPATVSFRHDQDLDVELIQASSDIVQIKKGDEGTDVVIPSTAPWDQTYWELKSGDIKVAVVLMIDRIRWSLITENTKKDVNWQDIPLIVEPEDFRATSDKVICIWFPRPRWENKILVGFDKSTQRVFYVKVDDRSVKIPLRSFYDSEEVTDVTQEAELKFWLTSHHCPEDGATICRILPDVFVEIEEVQEPESTEPVADPDQMPNCSTCNHARMKKDSCWCRRHHWPRVTDWIFQKKYAYNTCGDWRGEYFDADGTRHTDRD